MRVNTPRQQHRWTDNVRLRDIHAEIASNDVDEFRKSRLQKSRLLMSRSMRQNNAIGKDDGSGDHSSSEPISVAAPALFVRGLAKSLKDGDFDNGRYLIKLLAEVPDDEAEKSTRRFLDESLSRGDTELVAKLCGQSAGFSAWLLAVSYTHLTLPTKRIV